MRHHIRRARQQHLHQKQQRRHEKEGKFNRLRDARSNTSQGSRQQQSPGSPLFFRLRTMIHSQRRPRQTKDHKNKLSGKIPGSIRAEMCHISRICQLSEENILPTLNQLAAHFHGTAHRSLPERHIKYMMQSKRDQRPLDQSENQRSRVPGTGHQTTQRINSILDQRPYIIHCHAHQHIHQRGNNGHKPCPTKERQGIGQLDPVKPIVQRRHTQSHDHTAKHAHLQRLNTHRRCNRPFQHTFRSCTAIHQHSINLQQRTDSSVHNKISNDRRQCRHLFFLFGHTDSHAHCKQNGQIVKYHTAHRTHDQQKSVQQSSLSQHPGKPVSLNGGGIGKRTSDSKQQPRHRQDRNGQHKASPHPLQNTECLIFHPEFPPSP